MTIDDADVAHLRRCVELAGEARARGDEPFGSVLVSGDGDVLAEDRNAVVTVDGPVAAVEAEARAAVAGYWG